MVTTATVLDLAEVSQLACSLDPCASVYLNLLPPQASTDTGEDLTLRWRALSAQLREQGADDATISAIGQHLAMLTPWPTQCAVSARQGVVRLAVPLPGPPQADLARFGAPPDVVGLLTWLQRHPPYVLAVIDRAGADISAVRRGATAATTTTVTGPDDEIERNAPGGWAQARYQRRAEDSWHHNAVAAAGAITQALDDVRGSLLLLAGDVRAVQLLQDHLRRHGRPGLQVHHLPGGRSPDGSAETRQSAVAQILADHAAAQSAALLDRFMAQWRPGGAPVEGVAATLAALAEGRVSTLLAADDPADERVAWYGPNTLCAEIGETVDDEWAASGRLTDVAIRAALLTGADVHVLSRQTAGALGDRIGALCRFSPATPPETSPAWP
jgi:hypothetical protein